MTQVYQHQAKFRWTENLTSRFIQLRRENGKLFTGRKYSAQAGWEYILQQMRQEFPTIMADVHYRVLKKKWSNLLQQYKELKKPVHGDKNKADDVSWPFYGAIDEVLGKASMPNIKRQKTDDSYDDDEVDPHKFLCVSVTPDDSATDEEIDWEINYNVDKNEKRSNNKRATWDEGHVGKSGVNELSFDRVGSLPTISVKNLSKLRELKEADGFTRNDKSSSIGRNGFRIDLSDDDVEDHESKESREVKRWRRMIGNEDDHATRLEHRIGQFVNYAKRRDAENRDIMLRILRAVEEIADKLH